MTLSTFYRSPEWVNLRAGLMLERVNASGVCVLTFNTYCVLYNRMEVIYGIVEECAGV